MIYFNSPVLRNVLKVGWKCNQLKASNISKLNQRNHEDDPHGQASNESQPHFLQNSIFMSRLALENVYHKRDRPKRIC
jgi:hypothetical protein